jgi:Glycosyltransferase family 87/WD40-like Beta Propeller Repeat
VNAAVVPKPDASGLATVPRPVSPHPLLPPGIVAAGETLLLLLLLASFCWNSLRPGWKSLHTDFPNYYLAARLYREGYPLARLYDWTWLQHEKHRFEIEQPLVGFVPLTPFSLLPMAPLAGVPPLQAKHIWLVLNLLFLALEWRLLTRVTTLGGRRTLLLLLLAILPLRTNFLYGQYYVFLLLLCTVAAVLYLKGWEASSGATLAFAAGLKVFPGFFALFFLRKKRWNALKGFLAGGLAVGLLSVGLLGWQVNRVYVAEVLPRALRGESHDPYSLTWNSVTGLLHRLLIAEPDLNPHPLLHAPALFGILQPLWQTFVLLITLYMVAGARRNEHRELFEWGAFTCMLLVLSSVTGTYHLCVLILPAVLCADFLLQSGRKWLAIALVAPYILLSYPFSLSGNEEGWHSLLAVPRMWLLLAMWAVMLFALAHCFPPFGRNRRERLRFSLTYTLIALASIAVTLRGLRGEFDNYALRLPALHSSYRSASPSVAGEATTFSVMVGDGYRIARLQGTSARVLPLAPDVFDPVQDPHLPLTWVDGWHAGSDEPQVVALTTEGSPVPNSVISDAQAPTVSANSQYIAFIREQNGRGTLWMKHVGAGSVPDGGEQQETRGDLDVWEAAFTPSGNLVVSAARHGPPALFLVHPGSAPTISALPLPVPARYPAVSPDGKWLAFSHLEGGVWRLWLADTHNWAAHRLTEGNCNSITPAWDPESRQLTFAADCGRGLGLTALCRISLWSPGR